jgi:hypothetical protein
LTQADRAFLHDLGRVHLISAAQAADHHYAHLKSRGARSLARLTAAGLLSREVVPVAGQGCETVYRFANQRVARAFGGVRPMLNRRRSVLHELMTTNVYFALGRPADFRLAAQFSEADVATCGGTRPDALYTDAVGEVVLVEADGGHYTRAQVLKKMRHWRGRPQVWGQPARAGCVIPALAGVRVLRF